MTPLPRPTTDETGTIGNRPQMMHAVNRMLGAVMVIVIVLFALISAAALQHRIDMLLIQGIGTLTLVGCMMLWVRARRQDRSSLIDLSGVAFSTTLSLCITLLTSRDGTSFEIAMAYGTTIAVLNVLLLQSVPAIVVGYLGAVGPGFAFMLSQHPERRTFVDFAGLALASLILTLMALVVLRTLFREMNQMQRQLIAEASLDGLTGLANRRAWTADVAAWEAIHPNAPYEVLFFDLDRFKDVNDEFGHEIGDRVLITFAQALRALLPADAVVARFGGDEFVAFLAGTSTDVVALQAALTDAVAKTDLHPLSVNVSIGRATAAASIGVSGEDVLWQADRALLENKQRMRRATAPAPT